MKNKNKCKAPKHPNPGFLLKSLGGANVLFLIVRKSGTRIWFVDINYSNHIQVLHLYNVNFEHCYYFDLQIEESFK